MNLTKNEIAVLTAIDRSEYGESLTDAVWTFTVADHVQGLQGREISGTLSSLSKKGAVITADYEGSGNNDDHTVEITAEGVKALVATGYIPRKGY